MDTPISLLLVDDEPDFLSGLSRLITAEFDRFTVQTAISGDEALKLLKKTYISLVLTDLQMPGMDGIELLQNVQLLYPDTKVIILTGFGTIEKAVESVQQGAFDFLTKPVASEQLYRCLTKAADYILLEKENSRLLTLLSKSETDCLLGENPVMIKVRKRIEAAAVTDYPVLILGDSGTGKELASRMLHRLSGRANKPYVAINCPSIPDTLLESELFGHRRGAFTGADQDSDGLFFSANHGSLHLDEIGDISPAMQAKLLRFLQEGEVRPVGSTQTRKLNVRIIASTNQPLDKKVEENSFRGDLFYRLNVIAIRLPPLAERTEDIPLLARFLFEKTFAELHTSGIPIEPEVLSYLSVKKWPGNVRELQSYVRRLVIFSDQKRIDMTAIQRIEEPDAIGSSGQEGLGPYKEMKNIVTDRFANSYLQQLLLQTGGNVSKASRVSGLSRVAIQKLSRRLGMDIDQFR